MDSDIAARGTGLGNYFASGLRDACRDNVRARSLRQSGRARTRIAWNAERKFQSSRLVVQRLDGHFPDDGVGRVLVTPIDNSAFCLAGQRRGDQMMNIRAFLKKLADANIFRDRIELAAERPMEREAGAGTGKFRKI
jgi:hypothetical protein